MVKKYGEPKRGQTAEMLWGGDPDYPKLRPMSAESDRFVNEACDLTDLILATHATSMESVLAKVRLALSEWPGKTFAHEPFEPEIHEQIAFAVLQDVERFLMEALAPERPHAGSAVAAGADPETAGQHATGTG